MNREWLIESATALKQVNPNVVAEYVQVSEMAVAAVNEALLGRPDIVELIGKNNIQMMKDNHSNHARFIASILNHYQPVVFVDTVLWVFRAYRSRGFVSTYWAAQLNAWITVLKEMLQPESYSEVFQYYNWMLVNIPQFIAVTEAQNGSSHYQD